MPTRDRSLLGVGDERPPQPDDPAASIAVRVASERDGELHEFRPHYPGLHGLASDLVGEAHADDVVAEALARCLVRKPLARWDRTDLHHAVVVVAGEHERAGDVALPVTSGTRRRREPGAATVLAAAHHLIATGHAAGPIAREHRAARRGGALASLLAVVAVAMAVVAVGLETNPSGIEVGPAVGPRVSQLVYPIEREIIGVPGTGPVDPLSYWHDYNLRFSKIPGIEVPVGAYVDANRDHFRRALLGDVYTIAATRGGPAIGYHHQLFGYLPAAIVDAPGFEWVTWVAEHNECAPACLPALPDPAIATATSLPTAS